MWKVRRTEDEDGVVLSLSGRLQRENLNELRRVFVSEAAGHSLILDLKDLRLVDHAVVAFLADYEASGASMRNCPAYIREWIGAEQAATESYRSESPRIRPSPGLFSLDFVNPRAFVN